MIQPSFIFLHVQQAECAGASVYGYCRGCLLEIDLIEMHELLDLAL
jgi:hypothetical protein